MIWVAGRNGDHARALALTEKLLERYPSDEPLQAQRAIELGLVGRVVEARAAADELVRQRPNSAFAHHIQCYELAAGGDAETGLPACAQALRLDPKSHDARVIQGWVQLAVGRVSAASDDFEQAVALRRTASALAGKALCALKRGHLADAEAAADEALSLDMANTEANLVKAEVSLAHGDVDAARPRYREALKRSGPNWFEGRQASEALRRLASDE